MLACLLRKLMVKQLCVTPDEDVYRLLEVVVGDAF
jgi:hypothetical protein